MEIKKVKSTNKIIAKNTLMLYIRMLLSMSISLYTSRVILETLGVEDYGIYNIVGGVVVLLSFINNAMASATERFLNFELGKQNYLEVERVFSMSMTAHIFIAVVILILSESIGFYFFTQLNIPQNRFDAAVWVYQISVLTFCISILRVPYNASVIAYEKMSFFAYISIVEVILKLLIVYLLLLWDFDKLKLYSLLNLLVVLLTNFVYRFFCKKNIDTCIYHFFWDAPLFKRIMGFSSWSLFGSIANVGAQQGINFLLNIFGGVVINAAVGIANQVSAAIYAFISNFQVAFNPQIVKTYAGGEKNHLFELIFKTSKYSFLLFYILSIPIFINMSFILTLWLDNVPPYSVEFTRLLIIFYLIEALSAPFWITVQATGVISKYQILIAFIIVMNLPFSYLSLKLVNPVDSVFIIRAGINLVAFMVRVGFLKYSIGFPMLKYFKHVIFPLLVIILLSVPFPVFLKYKFMGVEAFIYSSISFVFLTIILIFIFGLDMSERKYLMNIFRLKVK